MTPVILNPNAHGGRAVELWNRVARYVPGSVMADGAPAAIAQAIALGERIFIAAGGDGTVNALLNAIVDAKGALPLDAFTLGAVGLGSSNDFHKPFARVENGIPLKVDDARTTLRDVGLIRSENGARYFLIGASFGAAATGNALFNAGTGLTGWLKPRWTGGAIACAALRAIAGHRNMHPAEKAGREARPTGLPAFASLSVMKSQYLSGSFRFDGPVAAGDGLFAVNLCGATGRLGLVRVLYNLRRGRFSGTAGCTSWRAPAVNFETAFPIAAEVDGEIMEGRRFELSILPERIRVCG
jgi:diacylglycerol kinase family enzyme